MNDRSMQIYLAWRPMENRLAALVYRIENFLWGDARAQHTCLILRTENERLLIIEVDVGNEKNSFRKSMKLIVKRLDEMPRSLTQVEWIGTIETFDAFDELLRTAENYVNKYPSYNTLRNNCRTFIDYLVTQIPELRDRLPSKNGSVLEYFHDKAKVEHPGVLSTVTQRIQIIFYIGVLKQILVLSNRKIENKSP